MPEGSSPRLESIAPVLAGWQNYGELLVNRRRFDEARVARRHALALRPSAARVRLLLLATTERELGDVGAAAWHLHEALRTSPFPAEVWRATARLRLAPEDWQGAAEAYRKRLEHDPADERVAKALQQLEVQGRMSLV